MPPEPTFPCNGHSELRQLSFFTSRDLVDERTASSEIGLKLYHARRLGAGRQHLIAEAPLELSRVMHQGTLRGDKVCDPWSLVPCSRFPSGPPLRLLDFLVLRLLLLLAGALLLALFLGLSCRPCRPSCSSIRFVVRCGHSHNSTKYHTHRHGIARRSEPQQTKTHLDQANKDIRKYWSPAERSSATVRRMMTPTTSNCPRGDSIPFP